MRVLRISRRSLGALLAAAAVALGAAGELAGTCGPFTDTANDAFCPFVLEIFYLGITTGTTATTYSPSDNVTRLQMAAFLSRTVDGALKRRGKRSALRRFWTPQNDQALGLTTVGQTPLLVKFDGADLWTAELATVGRVRASDGRLLESWTGAINAFGILPAIGKILVTGAQPVGTLYLIDPSQPAGAVTIVASNLGNVPAGIAFDGTRFFTANESGSVSIVTPGPVIPWTVTTVTSGFGLPEGAIFDGASVWITDNVANTLLKLDAGGAVLQTVTVGANPVLPMFDGSNLWVPNYGDASISVVRASSGAVIATLTGNALNGPTSAAFDGQRVLVADYLGNAVSIFKAADLTAVSNIPISGNVGSYGAASDGVSFFVSFANANKVARF